MKVKFGELVALMPQRNWSLALLVVNLTIILAVVLAKNLLPPVIPLFYGNPYGAQQLAPRESLILPAVAALLICLASIIIGGILKEDFIKKVLFGGMFLITILSLVTIIKIIFLIGNL